MKRKTHLIKNLIISFALIAALILPLFNFPQKARAAFDPEQALKFGDYAKNNAIDDGVLFVGIYLIDLNGLNDSNYEQAMDSASDSGQDTIYYKSELADGSWFSMSDSGSLADITSTGTPVDQDDLNDLYVKYFINEKGVLTDLYDQKEKNPFDLVDPYDLRNLPELEALKNQYTYSKEKSEITVQEFLKNRNSADKGTTRVDVYYYRSISVFFGLNLRDDETDTLDGQLDRLYQCYKAYKANNDEEEAELVYDLMERVDAARRMIVFEKLSQLEENALDELYDFINGAYYTKSGEFKNAETENKATGIPDWLLELRNALKRDGAPASGKGIFAMISAVFGGGDNWWAPISFTFFAPSSDDDDEEEGGGSEEIMIPDSSLVEAVSGCVSSCQDSYRKYEAKALRDSESVVDHALYEYANLVINGATPSGITADTVNYKHADNIKRGIVRDQEGELAFLDFVLLPRAEDIYSISIHEGTSGEYRAAVAGNKSAGVLDNALQLQKLSVETKRSELQFIVDARHKRMSPAEAVEDCFVKITLADSWKDGIRDDAFKEKARQSDDDYIIWLKSEADKYKDMDEDLKSELDELKDKKDDLTKEMQACLDDNDLAGAKDFEAMIEAVDNDIDDEIARLTAELENSGSAGETASILSDLGNSGAGLTDKILDKAKGRISSGDMDGLKNSMAALAGLGATDALNEIKDSLEASGDASASLMKELEDAIAEAKANAGNGLGSGEGSGSGNGEGSGEGSGSGSGEGSGEGSGSGSGEGSGSGSGSGEGSGSGSGEGSGSGSGSGEGSGSGSGSGTGVDVSGLTGDDLLNALYALFGDPRGWSDEVLAAVIDGLSQLADDGSIPAGRMAKDYLNTALGRGNKYIFKKYDGDTAKEYVLVRTIGKVTNYRYLFNQDRNVAQLTMNDTVYYFEVGKAVGYLGGVEFELITDCVYSYGFYIFEDDSFDNFKCDAQYVPDRNYAVCVTRNVNALAQQLMNALKEE